MQRREFINHLGWGAAAGLAGLWLNLFSKQATAAESTMQQPNSELIMVNWCAHSISGKYLTPPPEYDVRPEGFGPDDVREWVALCGGFGVSSIFWRGQYVGKATYHSNVLPVMKPLEEDYYVKRGLDQDRWEPSRRQLSGIAEAIRDFDPLDVALAEAHNRGIKFYGNLALFDMYFPGLENDFFEQHPEYWLLAHDQRTAFRGIPCYAEPAVQDYVLAEIKELVDRGVDGISFTLESHYAGQEVGGPDSFAFNPPVVEAYQRRYGINILRDELDPNRLLRLNGRIFTEFLQQVRAVLGPDRRLIAATPSSGWCGYGGPGGGQISNRFFQGEPAPVHDTPSYRLRLEWRKWMREGIADDLMVYAPVPDAVSKVQQAVKSRLTEQRVLLQRSVWNEKHYGDYRKELAAIRGGALDGYVMHELSYFFGGNPWLQLLQTR